MKLKIATSEKGLNILINAETGDVLWSEEKYLKKAKKKETKQSVKASIDLELKKDMKNYFFDYYFSKFGFKYVWSIKDSKLLIGLIGKIRSIKPDITDEELLKAFQIIVNVPNQWIQDKISIGILHSMFNQIIATIKNNKTTNNGKPSNNSAKKSNLNDIQSFRDNFVKNADARTGNL